MIFSCICIFVRKVRLSGVRVTLFTFEHSSKCVYTEANVVGLFCFVSYYFHSLSADFPLN